jgi:3-phenylpropionate/trans-cinnamate dioxygenase ferredoxin reductase subunit
MIGPDDTVVVVGASIAGVTAVEELIVRGHRGRIVLIDSDDAEPYARPPLSKGVLTGADEPSSALLPPLDRSRVQLVLGDQAVALDRKSQVVRLASGRAIAYSGLVIASGARARTLANLGKNTSGIDEHVLRSLRDVVRLRDAITDAASIAIVGGGVLGMEIASASVGLGLATTVITDEAPLLRQCGAWISDLVTRQAVASGVDIRIDPNGASLLRRSDGQPAVQLSDTMLHADLIVTAIGDIPNVEWLGDTGIHCSPGVVVDSRCRVTENIVAAGDVAAFGFPPRRNPQWSNAIDQARVAAAALMHGDAADELIHRPYFWTDQFALSLKMGGPAPFVGRPEIIDGSVDDLAAILQWNDNGRAIGALALNKRIPISRLHRVAGNPPATTR